jgi:peptidoglycan/xylan/chitin deacetylase (PgdA/CDA1 family)
VLALLTPALIFGCGQKSKPPVFAAPSSAPAATPSSTPTLTPSETPTPTPTPAVTRSRTPESGTTPTKQPTTQPPPPVKNLDWYLSQVPNFKAAPAPQKIALPGGPSAPFWFRVPTAQKVAFITIDDGALARRPEVIEFIRRANIPVTLFLNSPAATSYTPYFHSIQDAGGVVENHTITHTSLKGKSYDFQKHEICGSADKLGQLFGKRPTLFRPPFGNKDDVTLRAAHDCGMKVVFYWTQTVDKGVVRYQTAEKVVKPGDVLLMHFRPALMDDLLASLKAIYRSGLTPALIEDYID